MFRQYISSIKQILNSSEPEDGFKLQIILLKYLGVFQFSSTNIFLKCLSILPTLLVFQLTVTGLIYLMLDDVSLADKLQGSFTGTTALLCLVKLYYVRKHQRKLLYVVLQLKSRVRDMNETERKILHEEAIFPAAASFLVLQSLLIISCLFYGLFPVGKNNHNKALPLYGWYPNFLMVGIPYKVTYVLQDLSSIFSGFVWVAVDTINFGLLAHNNVMLKVLGQRIASVGWDASDKKTNKENYEKVCECVKYHIQILSYKSESSQIYSDVLFAKVTMSVVIFCSFIYSVTMELASIGGSVAGFGVLTIIVSTLFVISWMSEKIAVTSYELLNKAAECNFIYMDRKTTKALIIFMQGLTKNVYVEVGALFKVRLNLRMFVTIMEYAYKCLTLLKTAI